MQCVFFDSTLTLPCYFRCHRACSQLKIHIGILTYKQWLLSIDMKTKVVQHVESDWMRDWKSVRVRERECVRVRAWECESDLWASMSIDMKTSQIVRECESERMRECECERVREFFKTFLRNYFWFPAFVWRSDIYIFFPSWHDVLVLRL